MNTPPLSQIREALQAFADSRKSGWKVYERNDQPYVGRRFEYRSGAKALLSAQPLRYLQDMKRWMDVDPLDLVKEWEAQVNVPFAAGPEVSTIGKFALVDEWVSAKEKALTLPLTLQECKSREDAEKMAAAIPAGDLVLLAVVFDTDTTKDRKHLVQELVKACVPAGRLV